MQNKYMQNKYMQIYKNTYTKNYNKGSCQWKRLR